MKFRDYTFTLIEMIIVVAIIAILASMLLPALKKAKDTAKNVACVGNIKQIGLAIGIYADDYEGRCPPRLNSPNNWYELLDRENYVRCKPANKDQYMKEYPTGTYACPAEVQGEWYNKSLQSRSSYDDYMYGWSATHYGINYSFAAFYAKITRLRYTSSAYLVGDFTGHGYGTFYGFGSYGFETPQWLNFRHSKRLNMFYVDGHVDAFSYTDHQNRVSEYWKKRFFMGMNSNENVPY